MFGPLRPPSRARSGAAGDWDPESPRRDTLTGEVGPAPFGGRPFAPSLPPALSHDNPLFANTSGSGGLLPPSRLPPPPSSLGLPRLGSHAESAASTGGPPPFGRPSGLPQPGFLSGVPLPPVPRATSWPPKLPAMGGGSLSRSASNAPSPAVLSPTHPGDCFQQQQEDSSAVIHVSNPVAGLPYAPQRAHSGSPKTMHVAQQVAVAQQYAPGQMEGWPAAGVAEEDAGQAYQGHHEYVEAPYVEEVAPQCHKQHDPLQPVENGAAAVRKLPPPATSTISPIKARFAKGAAAPPGPPATRSLFSGSNAPSEDQNGVAQPQPEQQWGALPPMQPPPMGGLAGGPPPPAMPSQTGFPTFSKPLVTRTDSGSEPGTLGSARGSGTLPPAFGVPPPPMGRLGHTSSGLFMPPVASKSSMDAPPAPTVFTPTAPPTDADKLLPAAAAAARPSKKAAGRKRRRGSGCLRLILLFNLALLVGAFVNASSAVAFVTIAASFTHALVSAIGSGDPAAAPAPIFTSHGGVAAHIHAVSRAQWDSTRALVRCDSDNFACRAAQKAVHAAGTSGILVKDLARAAIVAAPHAWGDAIQPSLQASRRRGELAMAWAQGLGTPEGRSATAVAARRSAAGAALLVHDFASWGRCFYQHLANLHSSDLWALDAVAGPAAGCWRDSMQRYFAAEGYFIEEEVEEEAAPAAEPGAPTEEEEGEFYDEEEEPAAVPAGDGEEQQPEDEEGEFYEDDEEEGQNAAAPAGDADAGAEPEEGEYYSDDEEGAPEPIEGEEELDEEGPYEDEEGPWEEEEAAEPAAAATEDAEKAADVPAVDGAAEEPVGEEEQQKGEEEMEDVPADAPEEEQRQEDGQAGSDGVRLATSEIKEAEPTQAAEEVPQQQQEEMAVDEHDEPVEEQQQQPEEDEAEEEPAADDAGAPPQAEELSSEEAPADQTSEPADAAEEPAVVQVPPAAVVEETAAAAVEQEEEKVTEEPVAVPEDEQPPQTTPEQLAEVPTTVTEKKAEEPSASPSPVDPITSILDRLKKPEIAAIAAVAQDKLHAYTALLAERVSAAVAFADENRPQVLVALGASLATFLLGTLVAAIKRPGVPAEPITPRGPTQPRDFNAISYESEPEAAAAAPATVYMSAKSHGAAAQSVLEGSVSQPVKRRAAKHRLSAPGRLAIGIEEDEEEEFEILGDEGPELQPPKTVAQVVEKEEEGEEEEAVGASQGRGAKGSGRGRSRGPGTAKKGAAAGGTRGRKTAAEAAGEEEPAPAAKSTARKASTSRRSKA